MKKLFVMFAFASLVVSCGTKNEETTTQDSTSVSVDSSGVTPSDSATTTVPSDSSASDTFTKPCTETCKKAAGK